MKATPILAAIASLFFVTPTTSRLVAAELEASDGAGGDQFGFSVGLSGITSLVSAPFDDIGANNNQGSAYLFRDLDSATGSVIENAKLTASDGAAGDFFGRSVSLSGAISLVGAHLDHIGPIADQGSVYVFQDLNSASGNVTQNAKLTASDGAASDNFGNSVSIDGITGLVGAPLQNGGGVDRGAAYVFHNLHSASGNLTQNARLSASDGVAGDNLGSAVALSGSTGLVGAPLAHIGANTDQGAAYIFRDLDSASGNVTQDLKLTSSDGASDDQFGSSVSLDGGTGLVGSQLHDVGANGEQGAAYVFRDLDTATGNATQNAKLTALDGEAGDRFGVSVSIHDNRGLVGALEDDIGANSNQGSAYLFLGLDAATGNVTQNIKITASGGEEEDRFGSSVSLSGDLFVIGAIRGDGVVADSGKAYTGSVSSMTTLDDGTSRTIDGISFVSQDDWIIGQNSINNSVTLSAGDSADVTESGKAVYIGQNVDSTDNTLAIQGSLNANNIFVGNEGTGELAISDGGTVSNGYGYIGYASGSEGAATVNGTGSEWIQTNDLFVGVDGTGELTISGAGSVSNASGFIGYGVGSQGTATVNGTGSEWISSYQFTVGNSGTGELIVSEGGSVSTPTGHVGYGVGSQGNVTVTGSGSQWINSGDLYVGTGSTGEFTVSNGGNLTSTNGYLGFAAGSEGTVTVTGADSQWTTTNLYVGHVGSGNLTISNGGNVAVTSTTRIGDDNETGAQGTVTVTGAGSEWNTGFLTIGYDGTGELNILDGGSVTSASASFGFSMFDASQGSVAVSGNGSVWDVSSGGLIVGFDGDGELIISGGGSVLSGSDTIGNNAFAEGGVLVTGAGSRWENQGMDIGGAGDGIFTVASGGNVTTSTDAFIGKWDGGYGGVTVTGSGSVWQVDGSVIVGGWSTTNASTSTGQFTIGNGGTVTVAGGTTAHTADYITIQSGGTLDTERLTSSGEVTVNGNLFVQDDVFMAEGSLLGGDGTIHGDLIMDEGAFFEFNPLFTLTVTGSVSLDSTFGVDDLFGLDSSVPIGTYTLINGTTTDFALLGFQNWGAANAYNLGSGKSAFFKQGSLQLEVIPEPSTVALLMLGAGGLLLRARRREQVS